MMDGILSSLLNLGIGGAMAAAVVYFLYLLTTSIVPALIAKGDKEIAWCREQIVQQRAEFQQQAELQRTEFLGALERSEKRWEGVAEKICKEIAQLRDEILESPLIEADRRRRHPHGIMALSSRGAGPEERARESP